MMKRTMVNTDDVDQGVVGLKLGKSYTYEIAAWYYQITSKVYLLLLIL